MLLVRDNIQTSIHNQMLDFIQYQSKGIEPEQSKDWKIHYLNPRYAIGLPRNNQRCTNMSTEKERPRNTKETRKAIE